VLILLLKSVGYEWDNKMQVSCANKIGTELTFTNFKSFINIYYFSSVCEFEITCVSIKILTE